MCKEKNGEQTVSLSVVLVEKGNFICCFGGYSSQFGMTFESCLFSQCDALVICLLLFLFYGLGMHFGTYCLDQYVFSHVWE
jgi:hypothetical protein